MNACMTKARPTSAAQTEPASCTTNCFTPRVDVHETEHEFLVSADIPGVKPGDISLNFENGQLTLHGKVQPEVANVRSIQKEYRVGDYYRTFAINEEIDASRITADYKYGVLTVKLPKREEVKPRKIEITL